MAESDLDRFLIKSRGGEVTREFFANSAHPALALLLLTVATRPWSQWVVDPVFLPALGAAFIQAWFLGTRIHAGRPMPLLGNCIGPALFTVAQAALDPSQVLHSPMPWLWWASAVPIGLAQHLQPRLRGLAAEAAQLAEDLVRALIPLGFYAALEGVLGMAFLADPGHRYLAVSFVGIGLLLGAHHVGEDRQTAALRAAADRLREYSEWLLGRTMLTRAMSDPEALKPHRCDRAVLFMDIRGFTRWSEHAKPEDALALIDAYYAAAEEIYGPARPLKAKFTGDEVFLVFSDPMQAARVAVALRPRMAALLGNHQIGAGIGLHFGPVIEGLIGGRRMRAFDVLGDTVNTGKRVCDAALSGQVLITFPFHVACGGRLRTAPMTRHHAKGKSSALMLAELEGVEG